jgi:hypothetical protein
LNPEKPGGAHHLAQSDRLTDAYQEVIEKYMEDSDSERKEAFVMGWDGLLDALAERDEADDETGDDFPGEHLTYGRTGDSLFKNNDEDDHEEGNDDPQSDHAFFDDDHEHPLQIQAQELAMRAMDFIQQDARPGSPAYQLMTCLLQVSGKLNVLNGGISGYDPETGFILAILKRCFNSLNEAVGACQWLMIEENDPDHLAALAYLRSSVFSVRDAIIELRRHLK